MRYPGRVECCICGIDCGPVDDYADETGLPGHILQNGYESKECEPLSAAAEAAALLREEDHRAKPPAENNLTQATDYNIPPAILNGLEAHRDRLHPVGDFLTAVLENNLTQAVGLADDFSMSALRDIVMWCYWELPSSAWGSREKVAAWMDQAEASGSTEP